MNGILKTVCVFALAGFALFAVPSQRADAANFTGKWSVSGTMVGPTGSGKVSPVCTLRQGGNALSGTCVGPNGRGVASGNVNGARVLFTWQVQRTNAVGASGAATFHGLLGGDGVIRGTWTFSAVPGLTGEFTAIRA